MKRIAAVHDLSGYGRASLTTAIPILSACGYQVCPAPTAVLSTITGFFTDYTYTDLTDTLPAFFKHWETLGLVFDGFYTGYLGSVHQVEIIKNAVRTLSVGTVLIDPVFGDEGELFDGFDASFVSKIRELVAIADIITPNLTEAAGLLDIQVPDTLSEEEARLFAEKLSALGPREVVITGIPTDSHISTAVYNRENGEFSYLQTPKIDGRYPGTGDIFASVLLGSRLGGHSLVESAASAQDFVCRAIRAALKEGDPLRGGLPIEKLLFSLSEANHEENQNP